MSGTTVEKHCLFCGQAFTTRGTGEYCNPLHAAKQWRARAMLAGTHDYDKRTHRFVRVEHRVVKRGSTRVCGLCGVVWPCLAAQAQAVMNAEESRTSSGDTGDRRGSDAAAS